MKQVKVTYDFYDKFDHSRLYKAGEAVSFDDARADSIVALGLGYIVTPEPKAEPKPKVKEVPTEATETSAKESTEAKKPKKASKK